MNVTKNQQKLFRYSVLILLLLIFTTFAIRHFILGGGQSPSVDALCPFGGIESAYTYIATGNLVPRIMLSSMILAIGVLISVVIFRRGFCGWICPFGTIQELLGKITKKKIEIPEKWDKYLKYLKYFVLIAIIIGTAVTGTLIFRNYDPFITFFHFGEGVLWGEAETTGTYIVFGILVFVLIASIFIERFWCRYRCPLGATMAPLSKIGITKIERDSKTCIDCKICDRACPVKVKVSTVDHVRDSECINCMDCVRECPTKSLSIKTTKKKNISIITYAVAVIVLILAVIIASKVVGVWQSIPQSTVQNNDGTVNVDNIRGWMPIGNVSESANISITTVINDFNLPSDMDINTPLKDIATKYNATFDTESFKEYLRMKLE
jgi:polyferredoxin